MHTCTTALMGVATRLRNVQHTIMSALADVRCKGADLFIK